MPLTLTEDQTMLKDSIAPFLAEEAPVKHLRSLRDSDDATGFRAICGRSSPKWALPVS